MNNDIRIIYFNQSTVIGCANRNFLVAHAVSATSFSTEDWRKYYLSGSISLRVSVLLGGIRNYATLATSRVRMRNNINLSKPWKSRNLVTTRDLWRQFRNLSDR